MDRTAPPEANLTASQWDTMLGLVEAELERRSLPRDIRDGVLHLMTPSGVPIVMGLVSLARRLQHTERGWGDVIAEQFDLQGAVDGPRPDVHTAPDPYAALRVQLRPRSLAAANPTMVSEPWWPGLLLVLMVDEGAYARSLSPDEQERFPADRTAVGEIALRNTLAAATPERRLLPGGREPFVMLLGDIYTTTHALCPGHFCQLDPDRGVIVGLPTRNCVLLAPVRRGMTRATVDVLGGLANLAYRNEAGPVSSSLYWTSGIDGDRDAIELPVREIGPDRFRVRIPPPVSDRFD